MSFNGPPSVFLPRIIAPIGIFYNFKNGFFQRKIALLRSGRTKEELLSDTSRGEAVKEGSAIPDIKNISRRFGRTDGKCG
ncbi:MAG: hypothetical protein IJS14_07505 [Lentisphaeria bacterium]|nr:hypothetical protein [Lentisphaeria bacterium]